MLNKTQSVVLRDQISRPSSQQTGFAATGLRDDDGVVEASPDNIRGNHLLAYRVPFFGTQVLA
ncbi:MAG: hypothetical protein AUG49_00790 [Catenulispora sp. 13_1_20CM_3_70_7]|nr:MAG: hypothetical protein AUG49_00790 [Catenulispora sp. 13_1_20CM_3_70_7]